jgi:hypothetical protein
MKVPNACLAAPAAADTKWKTADLCSNSNSQCISLREGDHLEDSGVDGRIILKWIFEMLSGGAYTGFIWLRIGTGGGFLCIR